MELKKYLKEGIYSFCFGAFPTYELLKNKPTLATEIIVHEKLEESNDIKKILEDRKSTRLNSSHTS